MGLFDFLKKDLHITQNKQEPIKAYTISEEKRIDLLNPEKNYTLTHHYIDIEVDWLIDKYKIPKGGFQAGNRVVFIRESSNQNDDKSILLMLVPQKAPFGYLRRGQLQNMVNDYIESGDKVAARVSYLQYSPLPKMKIDIAFFKNNNKKKKMSNKIQDKQPKKTQKDIVLTSEIFEIYNSIVVLDIETTGLSNNDRIIEISMLKVENGIIIDRFSVLINPDIPISEKIVRLTGITNDMLSTAKSFVYYKKIIKSFIGNSVILGHNLSFDLRFLRNEFGETLGNKTIDTYYISRELLPSLNHHSLKCLASYYKIDYTGAHRSERDCEITLECFDKLTCSFKKEDITNGVIKCLK